MASNEETLHNVDLAMKAAKLQSRFLESYIDDLLGRYVDPREEFEGWTPLDSQQAAMFSQPYGLAYRNEAELTRIRNEGRQLAIQNEFAINALENRISYVVGTGHTYQVTSRDGAEAPQSLIGDVTAVIDEFCEANLWGSRQQEIVRRRDRDGECFLRFFVRPDGALSIRFVEPDQVRNPKSEFSDSIHYGIAYAGGDMETPAVYYIDDQPVNASEIQHRKANVDLADPRGVPTFYPVRKNLTRAAKILRNMSTVAEIQAAIAMVRKHVAGTTAKIQQFAAGQKDSERTDGTKTRTYQNYPPGAILDVTGVDYEFPAAGINIEKYVAALQAELRAVASRLVMPEFMLSSDASNANYSSTLVAEGPAVKMFERMQADQIRDDLVVLRRVIEINIAAGRLPRETMDLVEITASAPNVQSRDRLKEAQADQILVTNRVMSKRTMAARHDLDFDVEREHMEDEMDQDAAYGIGPLATDQGDGGQDGSGNNPNAGGGGDERNQGNGQER